MTNSTHRPNYVSSLKKSAHPAWGFLGVAILLATALIAQGYATGSGEPGPLVVLLWLYAVLGYVLAAVVAAVTVAKLVKTRSTRARDADRVPASDISA